MCGIAGVVSLNNTKQNIVSINSMIDIIKHRGPDGEGVWSNEESTIIFGHRRLSIIDLSNKAAQPMIIGKYVITYNGEVYNFRELKNQLKEYGITFYSESDTEVILNAYIHWGEKCVDHFNGMWSFVIYDPILNKIFCSRDRFGIKPFYYTILDKQFYFASEIKAFTVLNNWESKLNKNRAYDFLYNGFIDHTNETLFEKVNVLRGGFNLVIDIQTNDITTYKYYTLNPNSNIHSNYNKKELIKQYREIFDSSVNLALRSDVKVGSALSGGVDSSCLVGSINNQFNKSNNIDNQECVAACFEDKSIDESMFVDSVAEKLNLKVYKVFPDFEFFKESFERLIWHQEEPFPTMSIFAQYCVFDEASKNNLTVMLDGQGADEVLAGYDSFYKPYFISIFKKNPLLGLKSLLNYFKIHSRYPVANILKKLSIKKSKISTFIKKDFFDLKNRYKRTSDSTLFQTTLNHLQEYGLHSLLRYEDKNSMAFSIESRVPFLDYRLVEFGFNLPENLKINNGVRKYILRESCKDLLPKDIYHRYDKYGFLTPQEVWTKSNESFFKKEVECAVRDYPNIFSKSILENYDYLIEKNDKDYLYFIWRVICFNKWMKVYKVSI
ncbi:MAG: asparagine synthase (glutamine-hydrolyzing) [Sphingobacteriia bacterium]|jgi:asparagine synthase (glutamine-hydrolysing)